MKRFYHLLLLALALLSFCSCRTSYTASMQSDYVTRYVGQSHNYIVQSWGAPTRQTSDGNGGTILIYEKSFQNTEATNTYHGAYYTPSATTTTYTSYAQFFINRNGQCYDVKTNHEKEWSEFSLGKTLGLVLGIGVPVITLAVIAGSK